MAADALALCVANPSATMLSIIEDKRFPDVDEKEF